MTEKTTILVRFVPVDTAMRFRRGARVRAMAQGQYLAGLVDLHAELQRRAEAGAPGNGITQLLEGFGLQRAEG